MVEMRYCLLLLRCVDASRKQIRIDGSDRCRLLLRVANRALKQCIWLHRTRQRWAKTCNDLVALLLGG